jgi:hypothetical protein
MHDHRSRNSGEPHKDELKEEARKRPKINKKVGGKGGGKVGAGNELVVVSLPRLCSWRFASHITFTPRMAMGWEAVSFCFQKRWLML